MRNETTEEVIPDCFISYAEEGIDYEKFHGKRPHRELFSIITNIHALFNQVNDWLYRYGHEGEEAISQTQITNYERQLVIFEYVLDNLPGYLESDLYSLPKEEEQEESDEPAMVG
jgi:hypothetical protein